MSEFDNVLKNFHEDVDDAARREKRSRLDPAAQREFDILDTIWHESAVLKGEMAFDTSKAWSDIANATAVSESEMEAVALEVAHPQRVEKTPDINKKGRVIPMRRYAVAVAAVLVLLVASRVLLQDEVIIQKGPELKTFVSLESAYEYGFEHMMPLARELLVKAQSDEFENRVYAMAGQRFDGETNVLVQDILGKDAGKRQWQAILDRFKNVNGNNYYPQVFIPDYYDYQTKVGKPIVVFYLSDQAGPNGYVYTGYHLQDGDLKPFGPIDEERLQSLRVWVMSINENVDNEGRVIDPGMNMVKTRGSGRGGRIDKMAVFDPKESWAGGASEIRVRAYLESWNGVSDDGRGEHFETIRSGTSPYGVHVRSFSREEILNGEVVEIDYPLHEGWDATEFMDGGVQLVYVIFEADTWPNSVVEASYALANGDPRLIKYASAQEHYDIGCVFGAKPPENWRSPVYPQGISDSQLISNFSKRTSGIFITTEEY